MLTDEIKTEIDQMTVGVIASKFRFFPSEETTGERGNYLRAALRKKLDEEKGKSAREQKRKIFGIT